MKKECVAMLLAGGQGSRLYVLTGSMAKPAVPFGGKFRIIDFPLSNCTNSGIDTVGVLTQYQPLVLNEYIGNGQPWGLNSSHGGVQVLPPYAKSKNSEWYKGTANAIYQNIGFLGQMKCRKASCHTTSYNHCIIILFHFISSFPLLRSAYFVTLQARAFLTAAHVRLKFPVRLTELHSPRFPVLLLICPMLLFSYLGRSAYFPLHKTSYPGSAFSALRKRQARLQRETRYLYLPRHI